MIELARPRYGHFDLGTGYHGDVWLDLDALFLRPAVLRPHVRVLADRLREHRVDAVCGPMEGGAFLAYALAELMEAAFLPAYRAPASEAGAVTDFRLAWTGGAGGRDRRVAVGPANETMAAALSVPFYAVDAVQSSAWLPANCPLCADAVPLTDPASVD
ncbi:MAG TPA: hypothetical protein VIL16_16095 [Trebonia sp.]